MKKIFFVFLILSVSLTFCSCERMKIALLSAQANAAKNNANMERAEEIYKEIIRIQPDVPEHYWELGTLYIGRNNKYKASQQVEKLRKMGSKDLADNLQKHIDL